MTTLTTRVSHQDNIFVDLFDDHRNEDFAELSNLLGDVFSTSASGGFESTLSGSDDVKEFVSSPVFNFLPPQATRSAADESESLLAGMDKSQAAQFYGQILEPARVSPTPSASANFALSDSTFLSAPQTKRHVKRVGLQSTQPESGSRSRKRKSHELQTSNDQPTVPGAPLKQKDRRRYDFLYLETVTLDVLLLTIALLEPRWCIELWTEGKGIASMLKGVDRRKRISPSILKKQPRCFEKKTTKSKSLYKNDWGRART